MIVTEFTLRYGIIQSSLERVPGVTLDWERSDLAGEDVTVLAWGGGGDLDAFESALEDDTSVHEVDILAVVDDRRLYQFSLDQVGGDVSIYPEMVKDGGIIRQATADGDGWHFRVAFPDRDAFASFRTVCVDNDIDITLHTLLVEEPTTESDPLGLTRKQRAFLETALDTGYFDIPRSASLADVAAELGISENAASERLRRGLRELLTATIASNGGAETNR